jgi:hypothetical protein
MLPKFRVLYAVMIIGIDLQPVVVQYHFVLVIGFQPVQAFVQGQHVIRRETPARTGAITAPGSTIVDVALEYLISVFYVFIQGAVIPHTAQSGRPQHCCFKKISRDAVAIAVVKQCAARLGFRL